MSDKRYFHLGAILSITTGYLVAPNRMTDVYDILGYMTHRGGLWTTELLWAAGECKPRLLRQHPQLGTGEIQAAVIELDGMIETSEGKADTKRLTLGWLSKMVARYGETLPVEPIPKATLEAIDPAVAGRSRT